MDTSKLNSLNVCFQILAKAMGHKRRITLFLSFDGIKIRDQSTSELLYHHTIPQISFISRDDTDMRAYGYVFGSSTIGHQFISIKTEKAALPVMAAIGQLFTAALERKKQAMMANEFKNHNSTTESLEEKRRRESSQTLRPPSPNFPSMPPPPPPIEAKVRFTKIK